MLEGGNGEKGRGTNQKTQVRKSQAPWEAMEKRKLLAARRKPVRSPRREGWVSWAPGFALRNGVTYR